MNVFISTSPIIALFITAWFAYLSICGTRISQVISDMVRGYIHIYVQSIEYNRKAIKNIFNHLQPLYGMNDKKIMNKGPNGSKLMNNHNDIVMKFKFELMITYMLPFSSFRLSPSTLYAASLSTVSPLSSLLSPLMS